MLETQGAHVRYYAKRLPDWTSAVHDVISYLKAQPQYTGKIDVLGISLGAQIAAAASVEKREIGALLLVDGAFPSGYPQPVRPLPPLLLIWQRRSNFSVVGRAGIASKGASCGRSSFP
ncbi:hypothetical protein [Ensifer aridi]|uniref:hypothetical protein n=1 Tax=Ensifer aridi TaxID=1708715 RepID=UPI0004204F25|nr:hypothetical protein [Ensifer aridi]